MLLALDLFQTEVVENESQNVMHAWQTPPPWGIAKQRGVRGCARSCVLMLVTRIRIISERHGAGDVARARRMRHGASHSLTMFRCTVGSEGSEPHFILFSRYM